ncbi:MAG: hypothetical protein R3192_17395 [Woeseiaceae bacterium]|nr:hypothetical protein [Woeseiaceae bacterium]
MRFFLIVLLVALVSGPSNADEDRIANAKRVLAEKLYAGNSQSAKERLGTLGLDPDDLDRAVKRLIAGYADCIIDEMVAQVQQQSLSVSTLLDSVDGPNTDAAKDLMAALDLEAVEERTLICKYTVDQEVGLVLE